MPEPFIFIKDDSNPFPSWTTNIFGRPAGILNATRSRPIWSTEPNNGAGKPMALERGRTDCGIAPSPTDPSPRRGVFPGSPGFREDRFHSCAWSQTPWDGNRTCLDRSTSPTPSPCQDKVGIHKLMISELNTRPGPSHVSASIHGLPHETHHSRPRQLAGLYLVRNFHSPQSVRLCWRTLRPFLPCIYYIRKAQSRGLRFLMIAPHDYRQRTVPSSVVFRNKRKATCQFVEMSLKH